MFVSRRWTPSWSSPSSKAPPASSSSIKSSKPLDCAKFGSLGCNTQTPKVTSRGLNSTKRWVEVFFYLQQLDDAVAVFIDFEVWRRCCWLKICSFSPPRYPYKSGCNFCVYLNLAVNFFPKKTSLFFFCCPNLRQILWLFFATRKKNTAK